MLPGLSIPSYPYTNGEMDGTANTADEETHSVIAKTEGPFPSLSVPTCNAGDRYYQPNIAWLGELLCIGSFEPMLLVYSTLGGKEDQAAPGKGSLASGLRLEAVEYAVAV